MTDNLPELTHLQFAVLSILQSRTMNGRDLRAALHEAGIRKSGPMFYQMMARLEEGKFVKGWYEQKEVEGQPIKERHYQILGNGVSALKQTRGFYNRFGTQSATAFA
jgi:DNA-binding PadR family transcriptional regulator